MMIIEPIPIPPPPEPEMVMLAPEYSLPPYLNTGVAVPSILEAGIPSDHVESSPTTVLFTVLPAIVTMTVLPGRPMPVKMTLPSSEMVVSSGGVIRNWRPTTVKVTGLELIFEPCVSVATNTTFSRVQVAMSAS